MEFVYIIGEPGVGKSTLLATAAAHLPWYIVTKPFVHVVYEGLNIAELGPRKNNGFSGTDGLSMSVYPKVVDWLKLAPFPLIFGEGDRLSSGKFFQEVRDQGYNLTVIHLTASPETMQQRRVERAAGHKLPLQNETWLKGRQTKVANLASEWATITLDGEKAPLNLLPLLREVPVFKQFQEARL